jgi:hypothetical protein
MGRIQIPAAHIPGMSTDTLFEVAICPAAGDRVDEAPLFGMFDRDNPDDFLDGECRANIRMHPTNKDSEATSDNDRLGLPRPSISPWQTEEEGDTSTRSSRRLPTPWINGSAAMDGDFLSFRNDMLRALTERRCCICGDQLNRVIAIAAANGNLETSGGWGHPRCVQMAISLCPHFATERAQAWSTVAWLYEGPGVGCSDPSFGDFDEIDQPVEALARGALKSLAKENPWGL